MDFWKQLLGMLLIPTISAALGIGGTVIYLKVTQEHQQKEIEKITTIVDRNEQRINRIESNQATIAEALRNIKR